MVLLLLLYGAAINQINESQINQQSINQINQSATNCKSIFLSADWQALILNALLQT